MSRFFKYLIHVEGGAYSEHQALIHTRQVHIILTTLDAEGTDLACLAKRSGMDIWDKFCVPKLRSKQLTGNTLKVYLRSMQFFVKFLAKGLLYNKAILNARHKEMILQLRDRLLEYRATIHRRTSHQVTTRKVNESFSRLTPADLRKVEESEQAKSAIKLIGLAAEKKPLSDRIHHNLRLLARDNIVRKRLQTWTSGKCAAKPLQGGNVQRLEGSLHNPGRQTQNHKASWARRTDGNKPHLFIPANLCPACAKPVCCCWGRRFVRQRRWPRIPTWNHQKESDKLFPAGWHSK